MVTPFPSMVRLLVISIGEESTIAFPASESAKVMVSPAAALDIACGRLPAPELPVLATVIAAAPAAFAHARAQKNKTLAAPLSRKCLSWKWVTRKWVSLVVVFMMIWVC